MLSFGGMEYVGRKKRGLLGEEKFPAVSEFIGSLKGGWSLRGFL